MANVDGLRASCGQFAGRKWITPADKAETHAPAERSAKVAALAGSLGLSTAWTLNGTAGRWTGPGVELSLDDDERGGLAFVLADSGDVAVFSRRDPLADIAAAVVAARSAR